MIWKKRRYSYDLRDRQKVKPTLYFTEEELKKLEDLKGTGSKVSLAAVIEKIVREKLDKVKGRVD